MRKKITNLLMCLLLASFMACGEDFSRDIDSTEKEVDQVEAEVGDLQDETIEIQADVETVKGEAGIVKTDVSDLKSNDVKNRTDLDWLIEDVSILQNDMSTTKTDIAVLQAIDPVVYTKVYEFDTAFLRDHTSDACGGATYYQAWDPVEIPQDKIIDHYFYSWYSYSPTFVKWHYRNINTAIFYNDSSPDILQIVNLPCLDDPGETGFTRITFYYTK